jgi:hypothetical protein
MKSLFFALLSIASLAADSFGQTIINSVPYTITAPGNYVLGSNLIYSSAAGAAIQIFSSNVTLDLGGHYLYYPGTPTSNVPSTFTMQAMSLSRTASSPFSNMESISTVLEQQRSSLATLCKT